MGEVPDEPKIFPKALNEAREMFSPSEDERCFNGRNENHFPLFNIRYVVTSLH